MTLKAGFNHDLVLFTLFLASMVLWAFANSMVFLRGESPDLYSVAWTIASVVGVIFYARKVSR